MLGITPSVTPINTEVRVGIFESVVNNFSMEH